MTTSVLSYPKTKSEIAASILNHAKWLEEMPPNSVSPIEFLRVNFGDLGISFDDIDLSLAEMWGSNFESQSMQRAKLIKTNLGQSNFQKADLSYVVGIAVNISESDFSNSCLDTANFEASEAIGVNFSNANMQWSRWGYSQMLHCNLSGTNCYQADFYGANLTGADCRGTDFSAAMLHGCNFTDALFDEGTNFEMIDWNDKTIWPSGFRKA